MLVVAVVVGFLGSVGVAVAIAIGRRRAARVEAEAAAALSAASAPMPPAAQLMWIPTARRRSETGDPYAALAPGALEHRTTRD